MELLDLIKLIKDNPFETITILLLAKMGGFDLVKYLKEKYIKPKKPLTHATCERNESIRAAWNRCDKIDDRISILKQEVVDEQNDLLKIAVKDSFDYLTSVFKEHFEDHYRLEIPSMNGYKINLEEQLNQYTLVLEHTLNKIKSEIERDIIKNHFKEKKDFTSFIDEEVERFIKIYDFEMNDRYPELMIEKEVHRNYKRSETINHLSLIINQLYFDMRNISIEKSKEKENLINEKIKLRQLDY